MVASYDNVWNIALFELPIAHGVGPDLDVEARGHQRIRFNEQMGWIKSSLSTTSEWLKAQGQGMLTGPAL